MSALMASLKADHDALLDLLLRSEPSLAVVMEGSLAKVLLIAAASEVESELQHLLIVYYEELVHPNTIAVEFVRNKAISHQYYSYFDWSVPNANKFFGLFGPEFRTAMKALVRENSRLDQAIRNFLELGSLRNQLVHQNYATVTLPKTADEIFALYEGACHFLSELPGLLRESPEAAASPPARPSPDR